MVRKIRRARSWAVGRVPPGEGLFARPPRFDVALAALLAAGALAEFPFLTSAYPGMALAAGIIGAGAAAFRRVKPLLVVIVATVVAVGGDVLASVANEPTVGTVAGGLAVIVILFSAGRWARPRTVAVAVVLGVLAIPAAGLINPDGDPAWAWVLAEMVVVASTIALGILVRSQQALRIQQSRAELAERHNDLANDIHDSVAHHMSAIALRAEGARQLTDVAQRDEAFDAIKQSATAGLTEVRHLITGIRSTSDMPRPLPGLGDLKQLAEESTSPTLRVDAVIEADSQTIPVTVAAVAYAIAREALTNVRRHATGATQATIRARSTDRFLDITITDNGSTPNTRPSNPGIGTGVMTERANSVGGNLSVGPDPTGGWLVAGRLPVAPNGAT